MSKEEIANAFVNHFYQALDSNPGMLMGLYVIFLLPIPPSSLTRLL